MLVRHPEARRNIASRTRGCGCVYRRLNAVQTGSARGMVCKKVRNPAADPPNWPLTQISSPALAPLRNTDRPRGTWPRTVSVRERWAGSRARLPPMSGHWQCRPRSHKPSRTWSKNATSVAAGKASAARTPNGCAPIAAMSLRLTAMARQPI
jgi:hypothetical protein